MPRSIDTLEKLDRDKVLRIIDFVEEHFKETLKCCGVKKNRTFFYLKKTYLMFELKITQKRCVRNFHLKPVAPPKQTLLGSCEKKIFTKYDFRDRQSNLDKWIMI